jgi:hypothetical protein
MAKKAKVKAVSAKATVHTAKPKGLQLSAAQWRAYNRAYSASVKAGDAALAARYRSEALAHRRANIVAAAGQLRKARLSAAYSLSKKSTAAHAVARTAAIAAYATKQTFRQSVLAHQNTALRQRIYADYERHVSLATRAQFVYKGESAYTHTGIMRTLDTSQAQTIMEKRFANAKKTAQKAVRSVGTHSAASAAASAARKAAVAQVYTAARAAGLAAARAVPPPPPKVRHRKVKKPKKKVVHHAHKRAKTTKSSRAKSKTTRAVAAKGKVAAVAKKATAAPRPANCHVAVTSPWGFGDPDGEDCMAAAAANSLLLSLTHRLTAKQYADLVYYFEGHFNLDNALHEIRGEDLWGPGQPYLAHYFLLDSSKMRQVSCCVPLPGTVAEFETAEGPHAALMLSSGQIASWGELLKLGDVATGDVDSAYELLWRWP